MKACPSVCTSSANAAIVADRQAHGNFASAEALTRVKGIGERIVELNKANILVGEPAQAQKR